MSPNTNNEVGELLKIWGDKRIEIYCCSCYHKMLEKQKLERIGTRRCKRCGIKKPFEAFFNMEIQRREYFRGMSSWNQKDSNLTCIECKIKIDEIETEKAVKQYKEGIFTVDELFKTLELGYIPNFISFQVNGEEIKDGSHIIKSDDKIEIIIGTYYLKHIFGCREEDSFDSYIRRRFRR